jgi:hypothetical protein
LLAQCGRWFNPPAFIKAIGGVISIAPAIAGDILDNIASRTFRIEAPYPTWFHVAFVLGYLILLAPIVWKPFRHKWLNYFLPVVVFGACTVIAVVVFVMTLHAK